MAEAAEGKEASQADINAAVMGKMAKFLPIMMFFIMISVPGALALYYAVSNIVAVAQQHYLLKQDEDELEEIAESVPAKRANKKQAAPKKPAPTAREKSAKEATVTRIVAKDTRRKK